MIFHYSILVQKWQEKTPKNKPYQKLIPLYQKSNISLFFYFKNVVDIPFFVWYNAQKNKGERLYGCAQTWKLPF